MICNFNEFSEGFRQKFLNHSIIYELFLIPKKYNKINLYSFFLTMILNSLLFITSISHSRVSPVEISKILVTSFGIVVLKEFELGFALLTFVLYLNIIISPYIFLGTIIYVLIVIYSYPYRRIVS